MVSLMEPDSKIEKKNLNNEKRDRISSLPDDLLLKILSSLCYQKLVFTSVLSKRWRFLWKQVTRLNYDGYLQGNNTSDFHRFVSESLHLRYNAGVIHSFHLMAHSNDPTTDLNPIFRSLAKSSVALTELRVESCYASLTLLRNLYESTWTLKTLILRRLALVGVPYYNSYVVSSLKTLHLLSVRFSDDESVKRLLSYCPKLENLVVRRTRYVNVMIFTINVPTLKNLSIDSPRPVSRPTGVHGVVINTPSLKYLNIRDCFSNFLQFENMPELVKANVEVDSDQSDKFIRSITSIRHLSLCSKTSKISYPSGTSFSSLEHLELCTCSQVWWNLLNFILKDAPKLQLLKLNLKKCVQCSSDLMDHWNEPCSVPECLSSRLEIFEWRHYKGTEHEIKVAKYILANASCLKMAIFSTVSAEKNRIFKELENVAKRSEACQFVFK